MNTRLIYKMPSGQIRVVVPANSGKTLSEIKARAEQADPSLQGNFLKEEDVSNLPTREFRNQWRDNAGVVQVDATLETEERWKRIRKTRDALLKDTDGEVTKALEAGSPNVDLSTYRQTLRDIPQSQSDPKNITWPVKP